MVLQRYGVLKAIVQCLTVLLLIIGIVSEAKRVCGPNQFRCRNGKGCVAALDVCDSERHCKDESEENVQFCSGNYSNLTKNLEQECSAGMYRCRFGGCITSKHLCDGRIDCFDGSDETSDICRKNRCLGKKFRCDYGGCIKLSQQCNGKGECPDGSDETRGLCEEHICSLGSFKCNYGACIPGEKVCDGKADCLDKSDEFKSACDGDGNGNGGDNSTDFKVRSLYFQQN
ncbi:Low-density lipoprotein receptor [Orchesella cincta]|uniref:Low-density lipoprotein receptor n=1 Tax=Orchesella cincta TaxID=48709 RepID=A0A1D2NH79_ORCCI|nr:Low-density lipoprotein receptor [Orchesella cincta]